MSTSKLAMMLVAAAALAACDDTAFTGFNLEAFGVE
jgi:hypothetical protein